MGAGMAGGGGNLPNSPDMSVTGPSRMMPALTPNIPPPPDMSLSAPVNSRLTPTLPATPMRPSTTMRLGQLATALQPLMNAIPGAGQQDRSQQQQQRYPVNFNATPAPYIPPPGAGSNNNYGY